MRFKAFFRNKKSEDFKISIAIMASFLILTFQYLILFSFNTMEGIEATRIQNISKILVGLVFLYSFPVVFKRNKKTLLITYSIALFVVTLHYLMYPENQKIIIDLIFPLFFMCIPGFIYSKSLKDITVFKEVMRKSSYIIFFIGIIIQTLVFLGNVSIGTYSMALSYYLLFSALLFADEIIDSFRFRTLVMLIITILIIFALGSRGPLLSLIVFVLLKLIKQKRRITYQKFIITLAFVFALIISLTNLNKIFNLLYRILLEHGINSRTLWIFINEDFYLSGRDTIYNLLLEHIANKPILGYGIGGDRVLIGGYAHNIFLELLIDYGVIVGGILLLLLILTLIYRLASKNEKYYNVVSIWISYGFIHLIVSSSYLTDIKFWILLGILLNKDLAKNISSNNRLV